MSASYDKWGFWQMLRFLITPEKQEDPEWKRPSDDEYYLALHYDGFITTKYWEQDDLEDYPMLMQDLEDLEQYLLPVFWEFNQKARHYQKRFYFYQRIFMIAAFLTTIFSVFNGFLYTISPDAQTIFGNISINSIFSILTAVIAARASYFTLMTNYREPRKRWSRHRRLAEELRITYFTYLARIEPYQAEDRVDNLRRDVLAIRQQERDNGQ